MKEQLISVIVPAYNAEKYLKKCVDRLMEQTYRWMEIIIVNDGSTDETAHIGKALCDQYGEVRMITQPNQGPGKARESGVKAAEGEYITFVDADDYVAETAYEEVIAVMRQNNCEVLQFGCYIVEPDGRIKEERRLKAFGSENVHDSFEYFIAQKNGTNYLCNKVFRSDLFQNIVWPDLYYSEDYFLLAQLYGKAQKVMTVEKAYYYYVQFPESACNRPFTAKKLDMVKAGKWVVEYTKKNFPDLVHFALFYVVTNCARMAEMAYLSDYGEKKNIIRQMKKEFRQYYDLLLRELKYQRKMIPLDKMTRIFAISPELALILKGIQAKRRK